VTVCVPPYNLGQYLPRTLASLAAQTTQLEVLVIDDGSTDEVSQAVLAQRGDSQFRY
jgi:glycosyltransferase involved in cell wall biosynthesis